MELTQQLLQFNQLNTHQLYDILQLRNEVFILEQNCHYQDLDNKDQEAEHLLLYQGEQLVGYCRVLPPGIAYEGTYSIGRVCSHPAIRKQKVGYRIMQEALKHLVQFHNFDYIKISAQTYLLNFYAKFGFETVSEMYLEDNLPHKAMLLKRDKLKIVAY